MSRECLSYLPISLHQVKYLDGERVANLYSTFNSFHYSPFHCFSQWFKTCWQQQLAAKKQPAHSLFHNQGSFIYLHHRSPAPRELMETFFSLGPRTPSELPVSERRKRFRASVHSFSERFKSITALREFTEEVLYVSLLFTHNKLRQELKRMVLFLCCWGEDSGKVWDSVFKMNLQNCPDHFFSKQKPTNLLLISFTFKTRHSLERILVFGLSIKISTSKLFFSFLYRFLCLSWFALISLVISVCV